LTIQAEREGVKRQLDSSSGKVESNLFETVSSKGAGRSKRKCKKFI
jgi:hypothetical protein